MQKSFFIFSLVLSSLTFLSPNHLQAQNIPNPNFDSLYIGGIDRLYAWGNSEGCPFEPYAVIWNVQVLYWEGLFAARLRTVTDTNGAHPSFLFSSSDNHYLNTGCNEDFMKTGQPFPYRPNKMLGFYTFWNDSSLTNDYGTAAVILKKFNPITQIADTIGYGKTNLTTTLPDSTFAPFEVPITYQSNETPDSIVVIFYSSGTTLAGGVLTVDSLSFDYSSNTQYLAKAPLEVHLFPNPTTDEVQIFIKEKSQNLTQLKVFNALGEMVLEDVIQEKHQKVSMEHFSTDIYFFHFDNNELRQVVKVVKN